MQHQIQQIVDAVHLESGVPGLAACVALDGRRYFAASGLAKIGTDIRIGRDARFDLSCLMKFFLSAAILKLAVQGKLDLHADVASLLPELGTPREIRLIHLMSHTSGCHGIDITDMTARWNSNWDGFAARFGAGPQLFPPGSTFNYEHSEHVILGQATRRLLERRALELVQDMILAPASVVLQTAGEESGICAHAFSRQKMAYVPARLPPFGPFWEASLPTKTISLDELISAASHILADKDIADTLRAPVIGLPDLARSAPRAELPPRNFSAACGIYEDGILGHNGSMAGQTIAVRADPQSGAIVGAGVNAYAPHARDKLVRRILDILSGRDGTGAPPIGGGEFLHAPDFLFDGLSAEDVEGLYIGSYLGVVSVERDTTGFRVTVGPPGARQSGFGILAECQGYRIQSAMPVALRFTRAPDRSPMLYLGVHAYKRQQGTKPT